MGRLTFPAMIRDRTRFLGAYLFGVVATTFTFTAGLLSRRHRGLIVEIGRHYGYGRVVPTLPSAPVDEIAPDGDSIDLISPHGIDGNVTSLELIVLTRLAKRIAPRAIFEFGTFDGRTTVNVAANTPPGTGIATLDLPPDQRGPVALTLDNPDRKFIRGRPAGERFLGSPFASRIEQIYGDSATIDLARFRGQIDLVFVDASHSYEYVLSDSRRALELLRSGHGTIVWHDYDSVWPGVTRALNELREREPAFAGLRHIAGTTLAIVTI